MLKYMFETDTKFMYLIPLVLNLEGGYVDHPKDPGGPTNHGIAYNFNVTILRDYGINKPDEIKKLTVEQAKDIYFKKYWIPVRLNEIKDTAYAYVAFDSAVNQGPGAVRSWISPKAKEFEGDGKNTKLFRDLRRALIRSRNRSYSKSEKWDTFGWGWMNRMCDVATYAERMSEMQVSIMARLYFGQTPTPDLELLPAFPEEYERVKAA